MTSIVSVSPANLSQRRQTLRRQKRQQAVYRFGRTLALSCLAGGLVWGSTQPVWVIHKPEQIAIEGNQILSDRAIRALLSLTYPESLLRIEPQAMAEKLQAQQSLIAKATVTRQLFPPSLTIQIQERYPVAIACGNVICHIPTATKERKTPSGTALGLLDESGAWMSFKGYNAIQKSFPLPSLKIIGKREQYLPYWSQLYPVIHRSPVKVSQIDWQDSENIKLKTELGMVHLGPYSDQLSEQLNVLDRLRQLSAKLNGRQIAYIDLKKPEAPAIQLLQPASQEKSDPR